LLEVEVDKIAVSDTLINSILVILWLEP